MKRVTSSIRWDSGKWDDVFQALGCNWRDKDYVYLTEVIGLSSLCGSLLDVGCGLGDGQEVLYRTCTNVSTFAGCDFSAHAVEVAGEKKELARTRFFRHDLNVPFEQEWDNVICLQTVEHTVDPSKAFRHLAQAARAVLIVGCPYKNRRPDSNHLWSFDETDFREFEPQWTLGQNATNIYWVVEKRGNGEGRRLAVRNVSRWERFLAGSVMWESRRLPHRIRNRLKRVLGRK